MSVRRTRRTPLASLAFVGVAALAGPLLVPAASAQAASGSLTVTTLGRHGAKVATTVTVVNASSGETRTVKSGKRLSLPAGTYLAMADIYESTTDGQTIFVEDATADDNSFAEWLSGVLSGEVVIELRKIAVIGENLAGGRVIEVHLQALRVA